MVFNDFFRCIAYGPDDGIEDRFILVLENGETVILSSKESQSSSRKGTWLPSSSYSASNGNC